MFFAIRFSLIVDPQFFIESTNTSFISPLGRMRLESKAALNVATSLDIGVGFRRLSVVGRSR